MSLPPPYAAPAPLPLRTPTTSTTVTTMDVTWVGFATFTSPT